MINAAIRKVDIDVDRLPPSVLLTRNDLVAVTGFALITFKIWAKTGRGPKVTRVEGRPRYRAGDVVAWLKAS